MDEGRMVSVSRTYAPNDFTVHLSQEDGESMRAYQAALRDELIQYASTHAENKGYHLMTPPMVRFEIEESLRFGEFGITAKLTGPTDRPREKDAPQDTSGQTRIFRVENTDENQDETAAVSVEDARQRGLVVERVELVSDEKTYPLEGQGPWTVGRSAENDVVISDPNVSRRHARLLREGNGFIVEDLGSTNGTVLNDAPIDRERIEDGDELAFGQSTLRFVRRTEGGAPGGPSARTAYQQHERRPGGR
jgi:predicted component of type VI protein secretion system